MCAGTSQQGVEEITWPAQRPASNQDGDSLAALMSNLGGGRTDNNSGLSSRQGASAGGGLGGLMQVMHVVLLQLVLLCMQLCIWSQNPSK